MQSLVDRLESIAVLRLTSNTTLSISIRTALVTASSSFMLSLNPESPLNQTCKVPPQLSTFEAVREYVYFAAGCAVTSSFVRGGDVTESGENQWIFTAQPNVIRLSSSINKPSKQLSISFQPFTTKAVTSVTPSESESQPILDDKLGEEGFTQEGVLMRCLWEWSGYSNGLDHQVAGESTVVSGKLPARHEKKREGRYEWTAFGTDAVKTIGENNVSKGVSTLHDIVNGAGK
jgi:hypothetical protein